MNLALEYLLRNGLIKNFLTLPCSVFMQNSDKIRIAVSIYERDDRYSIKRWDLTKCHKDQALPPMEEIYVDDVFGEFNKIVHEEYYPISYIFGSVPNRQNNWQKPMTKELYDKFINTALNSEWHYCWKIVWLWQTFISVYFKDFERNAGYGIGTFLDKSFLNSRRYPVTMENLYINQDKCRMVKDHPKYYDFWNKWVDNIVLPSALPGELIFSDPGKIINDMRLINARERAFSFRTVLK